MADQIQPTPRSTILGLFSDIVNLPLQYMSSPQRTQQMQGTAQFLYGTGIPKTLERMSYGEPLTIGAGGLGGTARMRPETADALMNVAPFAPMAGRAVGRMAGAELNAAMMGERGGLFGAITPQPMYAVNFPKSISGRIGNITPETKSEVKNLAETFAEEINKLGFSAKVDHSGSKAGASSYINVTDPLTGRFLSRPIRISDHSKGAKESQGVIDVLNPQDDFKKITDALSEMRGMGETLVFKQNKYADELIASGVKPKTAYQRAKTEITETQPSFQYPQEQALKLAQERAALPVEQGGLGLPANNTAMDRARAMGFDIETYHGTDAPNIESLDPKRTKIIEGVFSAFHPKTASVYAEEALNKGRAGLESAPNVMPLLLNSKSHFQMPAFNKQMIDSFRNSGYAGVQRPEAGVAVTFDPAQIRSRFAAFDPFRKDVTTATAMGVALPDLLAQPVSPMYTDPFGNTIGESIR